jgi:hypothetical protein
MVRRAGRGETELQTFALLLAESTAEQQQARVLKRTSVTKGLARGAFMGKLALLSLRPAHVERLACHDNHVS